MHDFEIVTDSTCDLPADVREALGVTMVPLSVMFGDEALLDQVDILPEQFYDRMLAADDLPRSSQPSPEAFQATYRALVDSGTSRILVLTIAEALSGTANSARIGSQDVAADIHVLDTHLASMGHGMALREAAAMRDAGETLAPTIAHLKEFSTSLQSLFVPDTLDNLVRNGRCTQIAGAATSILDIKLVLTLDPAGAIVPIHKAKGYRRACAWIVQRIQRTLGERAHVVVTFIQVRNRPGTEQLLSMMREAGLEVDVQATYDCGPVIATHTGIGLVSVGVVPADIVYANQGD
jgi:DegV family protein with EDD domain